MIPSELSPEESERYAIAALRIIGRDYVPEGVALLIRPCGCPGDREAHERDPEHMAKHAVIVERLAAP